MDHSFPYSTDSRNLQKNFHPVNFQSQNVIINNNQCNCNNYSIHSQVDMNTPRFPKSIFAPAEYGMDYQTVAKRMKMFTTKHGQGYYMSVFGRPVKTTLNFPYVLQVYTPKPFERTFQTKESALNEAPRMGDWRIVNVFTKEHVYAPFRRNTHSFNMQC